jgi:ABC-type Fe3+/spermidine/putrescine transport system ATPase subunit
MSASIFTPASRSKRKARIALLGPTGSGKTFTALQLARGLVGPDGVIAVIDTERASATLYSNLTPFLHMDLTEFSPHNYTSVLKAAAKEKIDCLIIDSLSHAWAGPGGALELVDRAAERMKTANSFGAWREVTPIHNDMVTALLECPFHLIVTMRSKMSYVQEKDDSTGKTSIRKVGLQPIQRDGLEYEFDIVADMDGAKMIVSKTRFPDFNNKTFYQPAADIGSQIATWLNTGADSAPKVQTAKVETPPPDAPPPTPTAPATTYSGDRAKLFDMIVLAGVTQPAFLKALRKGKIVPISFALAADKPLLEQLSNEQITETIAYFDTMFANK